MHQYTYYRRYRPEPRRRKGGSFKPFFFFVLALLVLIFLVRACVNVASSVREDKRDDLVLNVNRGSAEIMAAGAVLQDAAQTQLVFEGDSVMTKDDSYVTLSFLNGSRVVMDENTELNFAEYQWDDGSEFFQFDLLTGRIWVEQMPAENADFTILFRTDVMNASASGGEYMLSNMSIAESVIALDADVNLDFVDRAGKEAVVERVQLRTGQISLLSDDDQQLLLARENVVLTEEWDAASVANDGFLKWIRGEEESEEEEVEETEEEEIEEEIEEEPVEEETEPEEEQIEEEQPEEEPVVEEDPELRIAVTSPSSPITLSEAIAIEGEVTSGTASRVIVIWSGNGAPYQLGLFSTGDTSFRYVADPNYLNMNEGLNTYTVVAYEPDGTESNRVVLEITLDTSSAEEESGE